MDGSWTRWVGSELSLLHLARAFIMNPEVMVLQRPFRTLAENLQMHVLDSMRLHVDERGLALPWSQRHHRRPRSIFYAAESRLQCKGAHDIWVMTPVDDREHSPSTVKNIIPSHLTEGMFTGTKKVIRAQKPKVMSYSEADRTWAACHLQSQVRKWLFRKHLTESSTDHLLCPNLHSMVLLFTATAMIAWQICGLESQW